MLSFKLSHIEKSPVLRRKTCIGWYGDDDDDDEEKKWNLSIIKPGISQSTYSVIKEKISPLQKNQAPMIFHIFSY